jgi:hypothetical protein
MAANIVNQRRAPRFAVTPRGELSDGTGTVKALIQDISDSGMSLVCSKEYAPGTVLDLKLNLSASSTIECKIEVRYSSDMGTGCKIVDMDERNRRAYDHFLQEFFSQRLA